MTLVNHENYKASKKILVFNPEKTLILIGRSTRTVSKIMGIKTQCVSFAATGRLMSSGGFYFRYIPDDIEVEVDDIGKLKLAEWDELCGVNRKVFHTRTMRNSRKGTHKKQKESKA